MRDKYFIFLIVFILSSSFSVLSGQERVAFTVDRNNVMVGDLVKLKIEIQIPKTAQVKNLDLKFSEANLQTPAPANPSGLQAAPAEAEYPDFEIRKIGKWKSLPDTGFLMTPDLLAWDTLVAGNSKLLVNTLEIFPWDAGIIAFKPIVLEMEDNLGLRKIVSNVVELKVNAPEAPSSNVVVDSLGLAPIKEIRREPFKAVDLIPYLIGLLILGLLAVLLWIFMRTKKTVAPPPAPTRWIPVHDLSVAQLDALKSQQLWQKGQVKEYQSDLTHIVREYLENRYHIQALESPTSEILSQMRPLGFSDDFKSQLQGMLQMADMVKFAKAEPDVTVHDRMMEEVYAFIQKTKPQSLLDENEEGWVEIPVDENKNSVTYNLVRDKKIRKRVLENAHDFLRFEEAPLGRRLAASLIDGLILSAIAGVVFFALNLLLPIIQFNDSLILMIAFLGLMMVVVWMFFIEIEVRNGATPGKRMMSLQVMNANQNNISRVESLIRWIMKALETSLFPFFLLYSWLKKTRILLHDDVTDTRVYYVKK